jgi:hypothetical protein
MFLTNFLSETDNNVCCSWKNPSNLLFGGFFFICLVHFFSQRPLWLDEISIYDNIAKSSFLGLLGPLDHAQAFPRLSLMLIKALSQPLGYHVLALRLCSLVSMLTAFVIWARIYHTVLPDRQSFLLALMMLATSYPLAYYAAEFKPYAIDVLVTGLGLWIMCKQHRWYMAPPRIRSLCLLATLLPLLLFLSYVSFLVIWIIGWNMFLLAFTDRRYWLPLGIFALACLLVLGIVYQVDLRHAWGDGALMTYWESYFLCTESVGCFLESFWEGVRRMSTWGFGKGKVFMQWASFVIPFFLYGLGRYGFGNWIRAKGKVTEPGSLLAVLFCQLFILGLLHKYPFTGERITLFLLPLVSYGVARALVDLRRWPWVYHFFLLNFWILGITAWGWSMGIFGRLYEYGINRHFS